MLAISLETLERVALLLDAGDTESAGRLLTVLDRISLRALLIHLLRERGMAVAEAVAATYVVAAAGYDQHRRAALERVRLGRMVRLLPVP